MLYIFATNLNESIRGKSHQSWLRCPKTTPMLKAFRVRCFQGTRPSTSMMPDVGASIPVSILIVVDLPAPFGPTYPMISPLLMDRLMLSTTRFTTYSGVNNVRMAPNLPLYCLGMRNSLTRSLMCIIVIVVTHFS